MVTVSVWSPTAAHVTTVFTVATATCDRARVGVVITARARMVARAWPTAHVCVAMATMESSAKIVRSYSSLLSASSVLTRA